eukprot:NODE_6519_length_876_cov_32.930943_g5924_i0.p1 GENE.NODE_6519_length_876_cov_32.930943_g5924_i0~~NODE_6519_length_876_cov_32.930943_g5924_i0.p1  ORF type:complete len:107 (+),score=21.39 NODE_6519_length_876_cov_32.930943_g5924_i0:385-705(+)
MFKKYGDVNSIAIRSNPATGATFGFVEFRNHRDAEDAIKALNGREFQGSKIVVQLSKPARDGSPRRSASRSRSRRRRSRSPKKSSRYSSRHSRSPKRSKRSRRSRS